MSIFKRQTPKVRKFNGNLTFGDFSYGLYKQEVPRVLEEQLASLALVGGRNCWSNRGTLSNQYGYEYIYNLDDEEHFKYIPDTSSSSQSMLIISDADTVYRYTSYEPLKKYKTSLPEMDEQVSTYSGSSLYIYDTDGTFYIFGDRYDDSSFEEILDTTGYTIVNDDVSESFEIKGISAEDSKYFWVDKKLVLEVPAVQEGDPATYKYIKVLSVAKDDNTNNTYKINFSFELSSEYTAVTTGMKVGEKALQILGGDEFIFIPEDYDPQGTDTRIILKPKMMAVVLNRIWLVQDGGDYNNGIFYSVVGNLSSFDESFGAGYFGGFYQDTSEILSIEEFLSGALITKQNGMYHAKLTTKEYSYVQGAVTSTTDNYITIEKLNNIPQRSAGDHVIIGDEVIAYDIASGNLVQAVALTYLGALTQGGILLHGSELDSEGLGLLSATKRKLTYNFQEEVLLFYYGETLSKALVITRGLSIFPREIPLMVEDVEMFNQGVLFFTSTDLYKDFRRGTIIPEITSIAEFEPIGLNGNKLLCGSIIEVTELNNIEYDITTSNAGVATQHIEGHSMLNRDSENIYPNMIYSNTSNPYINSDTVSDSSRWAYQKSAVTRLAAPLSGRDGITIRLEIQPNISFCFTAISVPDFSSGE